MWLTSWLRPSRREQKRAAREASRRANSLSLESLEERTVLTTTLYLDFGLGLPVGGLTTTVANLRDLDGANTGPDLTSGTVALPANTGLTLQELSHDFNGKDGVTVSDLLALQNAVLPIVQRALAPFDVEVRLARAGDFADVRATLDRNNGDATGQFDAYVFVGTVTSTSTGNSVALGSGLLGEAAEIDLVSGSNNTDEVVVAYADEIVANTAGVAGTLAFQDALAHRVAYVAAHEGAHTLGLSHTGGSNANQLLLSSGDQIRQGSTSRETTNVFTRFLLQLDGGGTVTNYNELRTDADIGLADANRNSVPDFAYVTGTGAHDHIALTDGGLDAQGRRRVNVVVDAFSDAARTALIRSENYTITVGVDTEGLIRIDGSLGDDLIEIDPALTLDATVYGGDGDDTIRGGGGNDLLYGEKGNDTIQGRGGNDSLDGGDNDDTLEGGAGDDILLGGTGDDALRGEAGKDLLVGGAGNDTLSGGTEDDSLHGNSGTDTLSGDAGADILLGGDDNDILNGGADGDTLNGGAGVDQLDGGPGADTIFNLQGQDNVTPDASDTVRVAPPPAAPVANPTPTFNATLTGAQVAAFKSGLQQFATWAGSVGGTLPLGDEGVGAVLGDIISRGLVDRVVAYLDRTPSPTIQGVVDVLKALGTNQSADLAITTSDVGGLTFNSTFFNLGFQATRTSSVALDRLGADDKGVRAGDVDAARVPLKASVGFNLSFGVGASGFFVLLPKNGIEVRAEIDAAKIETPLSVGLLGSRTEDGSVQLDARTAVKLTDANADGQFTAAELTAAGTTLSQSGSLFAELPFRSQVGTRTESGVVTVIDADLSDSQPRAVALSGSDVVQQFAEVNASSVVQWLQEFAGWLDQVKDAAQLAAALPFTEGLKLNEVADFAAAFRAKVLGKLINADGTPNFQTAQELVDRLATADGGPSALGLEFNSQTKELTFRINFAEVFQKSAPLSLDIDIPRLSGVQISNPEVQVSAKVVGAIDFGIKLAIPAAELGSPLDRFFLRNASLNATVSASVTNVGGSARLGIFQLGLVNGSGSVNLGVSLDASTDGSLLDLNVAPRVSGSANLTLPIQLSGQIGGVTLPAQTGLAINLADVTDPGTLSVQITPEAELGGLLDSLESVAMAQVIEGLKKVVDFLRDVQAHGAFQQKIPVLNRSIADLLDTAEKLDALRSELENNPPLTIDAAIERINQALGSASTAVRFQNRTLEIDLGYGFTKTEELDLGFNLDDQLNAGILEEFVDVNASAPVTLSLSGTAALGLVIDLSTPTAPVFALKDTSGVTIAALVNAPDIDLEASVGPLGVFIENGVVRLDNGTPGQAATLTVGLADAASGRHALADLIGNPGGRVETDFNGRLEVNLPVAFPNPEEPQGSIRLTVGDLGNVAATTDLDESALPNFAAAIGNLNLNDLIGLVIEGLDRLLGEIEKRFDLPDLPVIGGDLSQATAFLRDIRERVVSKLEGLSELTAAAVKAKIFEALGPTGLNLLADRDGDGQVTANDITANFSTTEKRADIAFKLAGTYTVATPIKLDLGLDGLGLQADANLNLTVKLNRFDVGFGVSASDGFYFHTGQPGSAPELDVSLEAAISGPSGLAQIAADLGFLKFTATDTAVAQPDGGQGSYFGGTITVDLADPGTGAKADGRLTLAELQAAGAGDVLKTNLNLGADVQLHLATSLGSNPNFPRVEADFNFKWQHGTGVTALGFNNVRLNLGEFVNNTISPLLAKIEQILDPFLPVAQVLGARIPVISDLAGRDYTLLDLARDFGTVSDSTADFIDTVLNFATFSNSVRSTLNGLATGGVLQFGNFSLDPAAALDAGKLGKLAPAASGSTNFSTASLEQLEDERGFSLPFLSNPSSLFKLILGQDITLVTYDLPTLDFAFQYRQFFPVIGPLGVTLAGKVGATSDLKFGYDTKGLRQFAAGGYDDPGVILNGLYVSDTDKADGSGKDVPELALTGALNAFATVNVGFLEFGGGGGLKANVNFDLNDPDGDGRMYLPEIAGAFENADTLRHLIDIGGSLSAELSVYARALFVSHEKTIAEAKLLDFTSAPGAEPAPVLGAVDGAGVLRLNSGARAGDRLYRGETADGSERFTLSAGPTAGSVKVTFIGASGTYEQTFTGVTKVIADGGAGDDAFTVAPGLAVEVELQGGEGNDALTSGGGAATLFGGAGNDTLTATTHAATLDGGAGDDTIQGGAGADTLRGGDGNDTLRGGGGNDVIEGGAGNDALFGEAGNDLLDGGDGLDALDGGDGDDTLTGGAGNDTLEGGIGADTLSGGDDDDLLRGDAGNDLLRGGYGDDELRGGDGNDTLEGDRGNDVLFGEAGDDLLDGDLGNDLLDGGAGEDELQGGVGADELRGGAGNDLLSGGLGNDQLFGFGVLILPDGTKISNDQVPDGDDTLLGGAGDDLLFGGQGADVLQGEEGADVIDGESGEDRIQYAVTLSDSRIDDLKGGPHRDIIEILGTDGADDLTARQVDASTFLVERRDVGGDAVTATFQFQLPADPADRDIELLRITGLGGDDVIRATGAFNINQVQLNGDTGNDLLLGSEGDDLLFGGAGDDTLRGNGGRDELHGGDGNDALEGGADSDAAYGEAGNDTVRGGSGADLLSGGAGNDLLEAGEGILGDIMYGDDGDDTLIGGAGVDVMFGGAGNDRLEGRGLSDIIQGDAGNDTLVGGTGRDFLSGGDGDDSLFALTDGIDTEAAPSGNWLDVYNSLLAREQAVVSEIGSIQARIDALTPLDPGDPFMEELQAELARLEAQREALANELAVINLAENDINPYQQVQVDILVGGAGNDTLRGSAFADRLIGDSGNDTFEHTAGDDTVFGGTDPLATGVATTDGATEFDQYQIRGTESADAIKVRLVSGPGIATPHVVVNVNGVETRVDHLGIEVAGVLALGGNDTVTVELGQNAAMKVEVDGGAGDDVLDASTFQNDAVLRGGAGNDTLTGGLGADRLEGGDGNDVLNGASGLDTLLGGSGNDTLTGGDGQDSIDGGDGTDKLVESTPGVAYLSNSSLQRDFGTGSVTDQLSSVEEAELTGGATDDTISAYGFYNGRVTINGGAGNDTLTGPFYGRSTLNGGDGNDTLTGGIFEDVIDGGLGDDRVTGGSGNDTLSGGGGTGDVLVESVGTSTLSDSQLVYISTDALSGFEFATLTGGYFDDTINASAFSGSVTIYGGDGNDTITGTGQADQIYGGSGADWIYGMNGDDTLGGDAGDDWLYGGEGNDRLDGGSETDRLYGGNGNDTLIGGYGNDYLYGESGSDTIYGDFEYGSTAYDGADTLDGGNDDDTLSGGGGGDSLSGGYGNDTLRGGDGNDYLYGSYGSDTLYGDAGNDYIYGDDSDDGGYVFYAYSFTTTYTVYSSSNDWIDGGAGDDVVYGYSGADTIYGGSGNDTLYGGSGNDTFYGGFGNDYVYGGAGNDSLYGDAGQDRLYGEAGNDYLNGGNDNTADYLTGGAGADTFVQYLVWRRVFDPYYKTYFYEQLPQEKVMDFNYSEDTTNSVEV